MKKMKHIHMDGRESSEEMNKNRDRWFAEVDRSYGSKVKDYMCKNWSGLDQQTREWYYNGTLIELFRRLPNGGSTSDMSWVLSFLIHATRRRCQGSSDQGSFTAAA